MKYYILGLVLSMIFLTACQGPIDVDDKALDNVILIGWDGVQRNHINDLLADYKLPSFSKYFLEQGSCVDTMITTGSNETKSGWSEILTGYSSLGLGILSNDYYKPIPRTYTIFERLEGHFGNENIETIFIGGKVNNLGARGPHKICINCHHRDWAKGGKKLRYWDETSNELFAKENQPILEQREGEPYFFTKDNIDVYVSALGKSSNVKKKVFGYLDKAYDKRFFIFLHYEEPDEQGHLYGENSEEYDNAILQNDKLLEELISKLRQLGILEKTTLYLATDHGMDEGARGHRMSSETFFCSTEKNLDENIIGDRKDITPTILDRYGFDLKKIIPSLDGKSLLIK